MDFKVGDFIYLHRSGAIGKVSCNSDTIIRIRWCWMDDFSHKGEIQYSKKSQQWNSESIISLQKISNLEMLLLNVSFELLQQLD